MQEVVVNGVRYIPADNDRATQAAPHLTAAMTLIDEALAVKGLPGEAKALLVRALRKCEDVRLLIR